MGAEVGQIARRIAALIGCPTCGIGIAVDIVGRRWGEGEYEDWRCSRVEHACAITRAGVPADKVAAISAIEAELEKWSQRQRGGDPHQMPIPDARLPAERDDEAIQ